MDERMQCIGRETPSMEGKRKLPHYSGKKEAQRMGILKGPDAWLRVTQVVRLGEESESWPQVETPTVAILEAKAVKALTF